MILAAMHYIPKGHAGGVGSLAFLIFLLVVAIVLHRRGSGAVAVPESVMRGQLAAAQDVSGMHAVRLLASGPNKIQSIKAIRIGCPEHGLAAAKYLVDHMPSVICAGISAERAERLRRDFEAAGMSVEVG